MHCQTRIGIDGDTRSRAKLAESKFAHLDPNCWPDRRMGADDLNQFELVTFELS